MTKHYAGWAPAHQAAFDEVIAILTELRGRDPDEHLAYRPHAATLFVAPWPYDDLTPSGPWPLAPALIEALTPQDDARVLVVAGDDLEAVADGLDSYAGRRAFQHDGRYYAAELVPWLPGVDFTKAIRRHGQRSR